MKHKHPYILFTKTYKYDISHVFESFNSTLFDIWDLCSNFPLNVDTYFFFFTIVDDHTLYT